MVEEEVERGGEKMRGGGDTGRRPQGGDGEGGRREEEQDVVHPIGHPVVHPVGSDHGVADGTENCVVEGADHVSTVWRRRRREVG